MKGGVGKETVKKDMYNRRILWSQTWHFPALQKKLTARDSFLGLTEHWFWMTI